MNQGLKTNYSTKGCINIQIIKIFIRINMIAIPKPAIEVQTEAFNNNKILTKDNTDDKIRNFCYFNLFNEKRYIF